MTTANAIASETLTPLESILRRMGNSNDFPALSSTITEINHVVGSESDSTNKLTSAILRDVSLTNKLLHVVNTATYGQFGGHINTISKAVLILGFDAVRNAAMSLVLLEFLQNKAQAQSMKDEIIGAFFAGVVSKALSRKLAIRDSEEAMICTMFQNLGKLLVVFYMFEESQMIKELIDSGLTEQKASQQVLGISYHELGVGVAKSWNFPERLVQGMQKITSQKIRTPQSDIDRLNIASNLANELCFTALRSPEENKTEALEALAKQYNNAVKLDANELNSALQHGLEEISERALSLNIAVGKSVMLGAIKTWVGQTEEPEVIEQTDEAYMEEINALDALENVSESDQTPEQILSSGIQDVTNTLVSDYVLNDILQMVLETMYRGMNFKHILILVRDGKLNAMRARFGFGKDIEKLIPQFSFPLAFAPDVFHVALEKGVDIVIEDVLAANIASKIPEWHQKAVTAKSFLLLPVMVNNKAIGLFYADTEDAQGMKISTQQLGLLRTLRNQAVLAIKQKM